MKKYLSVIGLAILVMCGTSVAQTNISTNSTTSTSSASQTTTAAGTANNQGNAQNITFTSPSDTHQSVEFSGSQTIKNVPSIGGPQLTSSNDTCMGSGSAAASGPGFGISLGKTYTDDNCVMLKNSRELWNMGMKAAALARMCMDPDNKASLEMTGYECPQTTQARKGNLVQPGPNYNYAPPVSADPYIRKRLGIPEIASQ